MRLLNSICKVLASYYTELPVHIEEVPNNFKRGCFLVTLATDGSRLKNYNVYQTDPVFQIVYFGKRNEANQVLAEELYKVREELVALFLLRGCVPVIPLKNAKERPRYAKIETYSSEIRLDEGAVYAKLTLNFTEDIPRVDNSELAGGFDFEMDTVTNG